MGHEDDVIEQADALMRRHRSFVARAPEEIAADTPGDDVDIPVLTEVVDPESLAPSASPEDTIIALRDAVEAALEDWLVEVLPAAVANASQQVLAELDAKARQSLLPRIHDLIESHRPQAQDDQSL